MQSKWSSSRVEILRGIWILRSNLIPCEHWRYLATKTMSMNEPPWIAWITSKISTSYRTVQHTLSIRPHLHQKLINYFKLWNSFRRRTKCNHNISNSSSSLSLSLARFSLFYSLANFKHRFNIWKMFNAPFHFMSLSFKKKIRSNKINDCRLDFANTKIHLVSNNSYLQPTDWQPKRQKKLKINDCWECARHLLVPLFFLWICLFHCNNVWYYMNIL